MMNYKLRIVALAAALALLLGAPALAQLSFRGTVISNETQSVNAPFGGLLDKVEVRKGEPIHIGDPVATIKTTKVFADIDGTVSGIFAKEGDQTEGITERYGAVMYIEPVNRYVVTATTDKAYNSSETKYIHIGEKVYLSCTKDGTHVGTAVVTSVGGSASGDDSDSGSSTGSNSTSYKLEVTSGEFYMGETVGIYRDSEHSTNALIGRGTIGQNAAVGVKGTGSVLKLNVKVGDHVERGELLFETVEGVLDGLYAMDNTIVSPLDGIVAEIKGEQGSNIEKNGVLVTVYPRDSLQIEIQVSELDLNELKAGDKVSIEFGWDLDGSQQLEGTVSSISFVDDRAEKTGDAQYSAFINFTPDDSVRLGMSANVYTMDGAIDAEDEATEETVAED